MGGTEYIATLLEILRAYVVVLVPFVRIFTADAERDIDNGLEQP